MNTACIIPAGSNTPGTAEYIQQRASAYLVNCSAFTLLLRVDLIKHARVRIILDDHDMAKSTLVRLLFLPEKAVESRHGVA